MKPIYLLDTNAVSELLKIAPNTSFLQQFTRYEKRCAIASTTWNELLFGVNIMESGKKRDFLFSKIIDEIQEAFPVIQLDNHAAWIQADLRARLKESGKKIDYPNTEIAAIAIANQMILVTRNTKHFEPIAEINSVFHFENWFN